MWRYAITDRIRLGSSESERRKALLQQAEAWRDNNIDFVQLREKDVSAPELASLGRVLANVLRTGTAKPPKLLVNSRADVAIAIGADGVHLTSAAGQLSPVDVRLAYSLAGLAQPVISVSCHSLDQVKTARKQGVSLIVFGSVFEKVVAAPDAPTETVLHIGDGSGLELLRKACSVATPVPVLALGGITSQNTGECLQAGAAGIAAIRLFSGICSIRSSQVP